MAARSRVVNLMLALVSTLAALALGEGLLRLLDYRFSPVAFLTPDNPNDFRAYHMHAGGPRTSSKDPLTLFDSDLLWRLNPKASREINSQGFRGALVEEPKGDVFLILALGDSNTVGSLATTAHWPGFLGDLLSVDRSGRRVQVINAGAYGYTSFQGLRLFRQLLRLRPDLVFFSFGANDATPVRTSDADYARRISGLERWRWSRLAPLLAHVGWQLADSLRRGASETPRVPLAEFRAELEEFVALSRSNGVRPVLLTRPFIGSSRDPSHWMALAPRYREVTRGVAEGRGSDLIDVYQAFKDSPQAFADPSHFNRLGNRQMAELLFDHLKAIGIVETERDRPLASRLDLGQADDRSPELGPGWWARESWADGRAGRWTEGAALLSLHRRKAERGLLIDLSCQNPADPTDVEVHVNSVHVASFSSHNVRFSKVFDIGAIPGQRVDIRVAVAMPFVPGQTDPSSADRRTLGVFVHGVELVPAAGPK